MKPKIRRTVNDEAQSSAEIIASTGDILTLILLRLPIKSLVRFKLVSKHWHSLITNPQFCILRNLSPNPAVGLLLYYSNFNPKCDFASFQHNQSRTPPFRTLNFTRDPSDIGIVQSCNGLLLCSSFHAQSYNAIYYVYNPTTITFRKLPKVEIIPDSYSENTLYGMSLAFDPAKSPHYKVVCVLALRSAKRQMEVYSSETGSWRKRGKPFANQSINFQKRVFWNGAIHWIDELSDCLYFNPDDDKMPKTFALPSIPNGWDWRSICYFGESCGHLHYIDLFEDRIKFNVYEMKKDYSAWFVKYKVDLSPVVVTYPIMDRGHSDSRDWHLCGFSIFSVIRGEREEDSFLVLQIPGKVLRYELVCGTFETIHELEDADEGLLRYPNTNGFQYIESLSSV